MMTDRLKHCVNEAMRSRPIARLFQGQLPAPIFQELYEALQQALTQRLSAQAEAEDWQTSLQQAAQQVLTEERLAQLAIAAQQYPPRSPLRQYALSELVAAIRLVKQPAPLNEAVFHRTLSYLCEKIDQYDPQRGPVMAWVNYSLKQMPRQLQQEQTDSRVISSRRKLFRTKLMLRRFTREADSEILFPWLWLQLKAGRLVPELMPMLAAIAWFQTLARTGSDDWLFEIAIEINHDAPAIAQTAAVPVETLSQSAAATLSDEIRQYLETDPDGLLQKHVQGRRQATFQTIALARLNGDSWASLAEALQVPVPTLSCFYERYLKRIASQIKQYVQM
ncbi:MAG: hypothetical protein F6J97_01390 [Leptolyngbya sp. SIO4C1]|nr:hypothetical protein [Leptolyngbya sp. SIO4C1]